MSAECFHCLHVGHWRDDCPLLVWPADKDHHEARIATIVRRFTEGQIGPVAKTRMIKTENDLWKAKQKEMAKQ
jgi:hypothetical protein